MTSIETSVFSGAIRTAHTWLEDLRQELGADDDTEAYRALRATLLALQDRLTPSQAARLAGRLPLIWRGLFFERWRPAARRPLLRREEELLATVRERYGARPVDPRHALTALFKVIDARITPDESEALREALPRAVRGFWPQHGGAVFLGDVTEEGLLHAVGQFMSRELITVPASESLADALRRMTGAAVRHLVVLAPDRAQERPITQDSVVGMLSNWDALEVLQRSASENLRPEWLLVSDAMTAAPIEAIAPSATVRDAAAKMHAEEISALLVVDRGEVVGLVTSDDVLYASSGHEGFHEPE